MRARKRRRGAARLRRPDRPHPALLLDPGAAWVLYKLDGGLDHLLLDEVQDTAPAQWAHRRRADRGVLRRPRRAGAPPHGVRGRRPQAVDLFVPGRRPGGVRALARQARHGCARGAGETLARRDARRLVPLDRAGAGAGRRGVRRSGRRRRRGRGRRRCGIDRAPRRPCRQRRAVAARRRCPSSEPPEPWDVPARRNAGQQAAPQRLADALADWIARRDRRRRCCSKPRPRRSRPATCWCWCAAATISPARCVRALKQRGVPVRRARPDGADRPAGGGRPAGAVRRAAAARGRSRVRLRADQPARRARRRQPDARWRRAAPARCGTRCAAAPASAPDWRAALGLPRRTARAASITPRRTRCWPRRWGRSAAGRGCWRGWGRRRPSRSTSCWPRALAYAGDAPAVAAGLPALAAPVRRRGEARGGGRRAAVRHHDGARRQGAAGAAGDPAGHDRRPGAARAVGCLWDDARCRSGRRGAEVRCAAVDGTARRRAAARSEEYNRLLYVALTRAEDRLLVCGWQTRNALPDNSWYRLVERGMASVGAAGDARPHSRHRRRPAPCHRSTPPPDARARRESRHRPAPLPAWAGARRTGRRAAAAAEPAGRAAGAEPAAEAPSWARSRPPPRRSRRATAGPRFRAAGWCTRCCNICPTLPPRRRAERRGGYLARPGMRRREPKRRLVGEVWPVLRTPDAGAAVSAGRPGRGAAHRRGRRAGRRRPGGPARGAARPRAGRRLQDQPRAARTHRAGAGALSAPDGRLSRGAARGIYRTGRCCARWSGRSGPW